MEYNRRLGLYIPTYNRGNFLKELLDEILPQFSKYNFPIFISDNGSSDNTVQIITDAKKIYENIFVRRLPKNIGYAQNFLNVLSEGDTDYCWFFSDDDSLVKDALEDVVPYLDYNLDFYVVNASKFDSEMKDLLSPSVLPFSNDRKYPSGSHEKLLVDTKYSHFNGFASSYIIRKYLVNKLVPLFQYCDQYFLPMIIFYKAIVGKTGMLISKPIVKNRWGNESYSSRSIEVWFKHYPQALHSLGEDYSTESINAANYGNIESSINIQYTYVIQGIFPKNKFKFRTFLSHVANNYYINIRTKIVLFLVSLIPLKFKEIIVLALLHNYFDYIAFMKSGLDP